MRPNSDDQVEVTRHHARSTRKWSMSSGVSAYPLKFLARILELAPFSKNAGWARAVGRQER